MQTETKIRRVINQILTFLFGWKLQDQIHVITHIRLAFGIFPKTLEQTREVFKNAHKRNPVLRIKSFTKKWENLFACWIDKCSEAENPEEEVQGAFYTALEYDFGDHTANPLATLAGIQWLRFLDDYRSEYARERVAYLGGWDVRIQNCQELIEIAFNKRILFAARMLSDATTSQQAWRAWNYAPDGSQIQKICLEHAKRYEGAEAERRRKDTLIEAQAF